MDDFQLTSNTRISDVRRTLQGLFRQAQPENRVRATRQRGPVLTFIQWLLIQKIPGHVECQDDDPRTPFERRKWHILDDLCDTTFEMFESTMRFTCPNWFKAPAVERPIETIEQVQAGLAWKQWCDMLGLDWPKDRINRISLGLKQILVSLRTLRNMVRMTDFEHPLKMIINSWIENMPLTTVQGHTVINGECDQPEWLVVNYSRIIKEGKLNVVKKIKNFLRMKSRRLVRDNMNLLAEIITTMPIEIHDGLRYLAWDIVEEIKKTGLDPIL